MYLTAVILAGGTGQRFGADMPKQFIKLAGKPIIGHTLDVFENNRSINSIVIVVNQDFVDRMNGILAQGGYSKVAAVVPGGDTRQASSYNGLKACPAFTTHVLVHDAVRPFIDDQIIERCIDALATHDAVDVCIPSADTIVEIDEVSDINRIPHRSKLRRGQTPQAFRYETILKAHRMAIEGGVNDSTDDCNLLMRSKLVPVHTIEGSEYNIKITDPVDIHLAEKIFQMRRKQLTVLSHDVLSDRLNGKVMVVFGGNSGIGRSICDSGARLGATMVPFSRANNVDIKEPDQVQRALDKVKMENGRIDAVLICSAVLKHGDLSSSDDSEIIEQVGVNLIGNILVSKFAIPHLCATHGKLVFFASSSYTRGREGYAVYSATKAAIVNLMQALADELSGKVDVIAINPQRTNTPLRWNNFGNEDARTLLTPEFVALRTLNALASDSTGCVIDISLSDEMTFNQGKL